VKSNCVRTRCFGLIVLILLIPLTARAATHSGSVGANAAAAPEVLWLGGVPSSAAFVTEEQLSEDGLDVLGEVDQERLAMWTTKSLREGAGGRCMPRPTPPAAGSAPDAAGYDDLVRRVPLAFVGTVATVDLGYSPWYGAVSRLISVRVDQVISTHQSRLELGEMVSYIAIGGTIAYDGSKVCSPHDAGFHQPEPGDRLLVLGGRLTEEPNLFAATFVFPLEGSTIKAQPYAALKLAGDAMLDALLSSLADKEGQR